MKSCHIVVLAGFLLTGSQAVAQHPPRTAPTPELVQALPKLCDFEMRPHYFGRPQRRQR